MAPRTQNINGLLKKRHLDSTVHGRCIGGLTGGKGKDSEKLGGNHLEVKGGEVIRLEVGD